jgi:hypothetical protein
VPEIKEIIETLKQDHKENEKSPGGNLIKHIHESEKTYLLET